MNTEEYVGYVNYVDEEEENLNIVFKNKKMRNKVIGKGKYRESLGKLDTRIIAKIKDFDGSDDIIVQKGDTRKNAVIFSVIKNKNKNFYNGYQAVNLKFYEPKKPTKKPVKMTRDEWEKDTRPTILNMKTDWELEADDDEDWISRYKLPWFLYDF